MLSGLDVDLAGKVAVVTGGGGVLCGCMAESLARCGCAVAVADLRGEAAESVAEKIRAAGGKSTGVACDVLDRIMADAFTDLRGSEQEAVMN